MSLIDHFLARFARIHAERTSRRFLRAVADANATQVGLLREIIRAGRASGFGREHHFDRTCDYKHFAANVPIRSYAEISPYVDCVRRGQAQALFHPGERILMFALTSGTTAEPKYIPITPRVLAETRRGWNIWGLKALLDHPACILRHIVQITSPMNDHLAPSGAPCGAITGLLAATQKRLVRKYYTSPLAIAGIADSAAKYYTIMRLAIPKDVAWLVTANPATLLTLARIADEHRESLIRDINDGALDAGLPVEDEIRSALAPHFRPDRQCARRLEEIISRTGTLYPKDYWRLGFVAHWTGGTMGLYRSQFPRFFGDIPARDIGLIASEGRMSIPLDDNTASGVLAVTSQFFEFIPAQEYGTPTPTVLRSGEVIEGEEYFLLLTNFGGLYRYDMGDRVRIVGFRGQAPIIEFLSRDAHTSSLAGEKLTENQVVLSMQRALAVSGTVITSFVLAPRWPALDAAGQCQGAGVPYYRLYLESQAPPHLAARLDAALSEVNLEYASKRKSLRLGSVEVAELSAGTLADRDRRLRLLRTRTAEQFKHQYLLPRTGLDADLDASEPFRRALAL
jgi:hypothetical protein